MDKIRVIKEQFAKALWNDKNFEVAYQIFADEFVTESINYNPTTWEDLHGKGPESMIHHIKGWLEVIPDATMKIIEANENENSVIETWELSGTMKGSMMGIEPTNQQITIVGSTVSIFEGDKIKMNKTLVDVYGLLHQIGAV
ncbi:MAG: ester cyclase [Flavobacteriaceae bacterium]